MERAMSVEERIRRAEDIYNRRNGVYSKETSSKENVSKIRSKRRTVKKLILQIFICLSVYVIFYAITNREHIFSEEFRNEVNTFLVEKTIISEFYTKAKNYIKGKFKNSSEEGEQTEEKSIETNSENTEEKTKKEEEHEVKDEKKEENIGGSTENQEQASQETSDKKEETKELSEQEQMEKDAKEIKEKISFIAPIQGRISSTFGWRNPTTTSVPKYHTGLDIAANEGTVIKSSTDGKVILASSTGDYGKHYQIQIDDVIIVYAHCKKLYLKEGDTVKQGQEIAEVGTTGNSTGPHLHFEIRKYDRKIDPQLILSF